MCNVHLFCMTECVTNYYIHDDVGLGGGFHHCSGSRGGGFCAYADITLAIKVLTLIKLISMAFHKVSAKKTGNYTFFKVTSPPSNLTCQLRNQACYLVSSFFVGTL